MKIVYDKKYLAAMKRRQELDQMIEKFSDDGCLLVEDLFQDYLADYDFCDFERSYAKLAVTFYDELGNELTFMLSKKETQYVVKTITKKLDSMTVDDGGGGFDDEG